MTQVIRDVMLGSFHTERRRLDLSKHLTTIEAQRPNLLDQWHKGGEMGVLSPSTQTDFHPEPWLRQCLIDDRHLADRLEEMPELQAYLAQDASPELRRRLLARASARWTADRENLILRLQVGCISLVEAGPQAQDQALGGIKKILQKLSAQVEFLNDVASKIRERQPQPGQALAHLVARDSDDPIDLLMCGTDVGSSCQRLNGTPELNRGLTGYLGNGATRLLTVSERTSGRILTRAIFRLLTDGQTPVLFMERLYGDLRYAESLYALARSRANTLRLPLTSSSIGSMFYGRPLQSHQGAAPFEYCDAVAGICRHSEFTIDLPRLVWAPPTTQ